MPWWNRSLRSQLILIVTVAVLPTLVLVWLTEQARREDAFNHIFERQQLRAQIAAGTVADVLDGSAQFLASLANIPEVRSGDPAQCSARLAGIIALSDRYTSLNVTDRAGTVICSSEMDGFGVSVADRSYFLRAIASRGFSVGEYVLSRRTGLPAFHVAHVVLDDQGEARRVIFAGIDLTWLNQRFTPSDPDTVVTIVDRNGVILVREPPLPSAIGQQPQADLASLMAARNGAGHAHGLDNLRRLYGVASVDNDDAGIRIAIGVPAAPIEAPLNADALRHLVLIFLATGGALLTAWLGGTLLTRPMGELARAARALAQGDFGARATGYDSPREVAALAAQFNAMADALEERDRRIQQAELYYRTLVEQLPAVVFTAPLNGSTAQPYVSPQVTHVFGYTPEEWIALGLGARAVHPEDKAMARVKVLEAGRRRVPMHTQYRIVTKDGRALWVDHRAAPIRPDPNDVGAYQSVLFDITSLKEAEQRIRQREREFVALVENAPDLVARFDRDLRCVYVNPATRDFFQLPQTRLVGSTITAFPISDSMRASWVECAQRVVATGKGCAITCAVERDGQTVFMQMRMTPEFGEEGRVESVLTISRDITELVEARQAVDLLNRTLEHRVQERTAELARVNAELQAVSSLQQAILDSANYAILSTDDNGVVQTYNAAAERMLGYSASEIIGTHTPEQFIDLPPRPNRETPQSLFDVRAIKARFFDKDRYWLKEVVFRRKDGSTFPVELSVTPLQTSEGELRGFLAIASDITERKLAADALRQRTEELLATNAQLDRALRLKDEFLANMSHEFRTPLNTILAPTETLLDGTFGPLNERQTRLLQIINESGQHLLALINDILDLAKIGSGKFELTFAPTDIRALCESSMRMVRDAAARKQLEVSLTVAPDVAMFAADERRVKQILVNLLSNAVKFTPEGGRIGLDVAINHSDATVRFTVWDTGIGIPPTEIRRIFEPFTQLDSGLQRRHEGTGLGLALVARLVDMHNGMLSVESEPGKGSRFTVTLPLRLAPPPPTPDPDIAPAAAPVSAPSIAPPISPPPLASEPRWRLLLAEDNENGGEMMRAFLTAQGFQVTLVRNGEHAVATALADRPDLILMDVQMPVMSGLDAIRALRAQGVTTPIIALTGFAMPGDREQCLSAGANDYQSKPVRLRELLDRIRRLLPSPSIAASGR